MKLHAILEYLYGYFDLQNFQSSADNSQNGLQVEASEEITTIATAVDACLETFKAAAEANAQLLLVHHGLFWGKSILLTGVHGERVRYLIQKNLSLYAMHIPLDNHLEIGNNVQLAQLLELEVIRWFGNYNGAPIGVETKPSQPLELYKIVQEIKKKLNVTPKVLDFGPKKIETIAIVTGSGASEITTLANKKLDLLITGEGGHSSFHQALDFHVNVIYAGHYATETLGIRALGNHLQQEFGLQHVFIDKPTGF